MTRYRDVETDDDIFETVIGHDGRPTRQLRDGKALHVPLLMMDSVPPSARVAMRDAANAFRSQRSEMATGSPTRQVAGVYLLSAERRGSSTHAGFRSRSGFFACSTSLQRLSRRSLDQSGRQLLMTPSTCHLFYEPSITIG
jgi:hypothetical protein